MEQVTQAILGGVAAQMFCTKALGKRAWIVGALAGVLPDVDLFFEPLADPRFPIELHRTWTHALIVTPLGALVAMCCFLPFARFRERWRAVYAAAFVGWLTHGPLDACTSYGTKLWLPFSDEWVAWDLISIIDPVFSIILLVGLVKAARRASPRPAVIALCLAVLYLGVGMVQRERALAAQRELAAARGHSVEHARAVPALGSVVLWRTLYRARSGVHVDAHRLVPFMEQAVQERGSAPAYSAFMAGYVRHKQDILRRFLAFTDGLAVVGPTTTRAEFLVQRVSDPRYSLTYGLDGLWGMDLGSGGRIWWFDYRNDISAGIHSVLAQVFGTDGEWVPLSSVTERSP